MTRHGLQARFVLLAWLGAMPLGSVAVALADDKDDKPAEKVLDHQARNAMPLVEQARDCLACHAGAKDKVKLLEPTRSCDANCKRCHKDMEKHHPVGPEVEEKDKVPLPLLGNKKVACISCHDLKTAATDTRSWKSRSLFARLFQGQPTYKTYYLRINNSDGGLCKTCH